MSLTKYLVFACVSVLVACSSEPVGPNYDLSLYDGQPIDSLTTDAPPETEQEGIKRGDMALSNGQFDLALYEYIRSLAFEPGQYKSKTLYNIGRIHQLRGNNGLAERAYRMALQNEPSHAPSLAQLGNSKVKSGMTDEGKILLIQAINSDQLRQNIPIDLPVEILPDWRQAKRLQIDGQSPVEAYNALGVIADLEARHRVAQQLYIKILEVQDNHLNANTNLGYSYYMDGNYDLAQRFTLKALDIKSDDEKALNNLALVYIGKGEVNRALNVFKQQMETPEALNNVGYFLILHGKPDQAVPYLQQAIDLKPTYYPTANKNLEWALSKIREQEVSN